MKFSPTLRNLILLWLVWALVMVGYQAYVQARFAPERPDYALEWTPGETRANSQNNKPYLMEPFLNDHVSWDSEYYLSIAVSGYDDPTMRAISPDFNWGEYQEALKSEEPEWISMNYAFFPLYPYASAALAFPLRLLGLPPIATATLAAVIVSLLGALGAMIALYDLLRDELGESAGLRAAFYLLIWPAGMFLAQVYTEGLFLGLSFGALALVRRRQWLWAALLAAGATWTRAAGGLLLLPLVWAWWQDGGFTALTQRCSWKEVGKLALVGSPVIAYLLWNFIYGAPFHIVESRYFSRGLLAIGPSIIAWARALGFMLEGDPPMRAYFLIEFTAIAYALIAVLLSFRREPVLSLYSLATVFFSLTSGVAQGMHRYVMAAPVIFLLPARWGQNEAFDRAWTLVNILLMGVFAAMFSFDFWAG